MDGELISKKELLELTGISYGQLYRWKRKKLIPEDWFIKKASYTGQETYFIKDKILERIDKIRNMKDDLSLDDIAEMFSPELSNILLSGSELIEKNIVSQAGLDMYIKHRGENEVYSFEKILYIKVLDMFLTRGAISADEGSILIECLEKSYSRFGGKQCEMVFMRKLGVASCFLVSLPVEYYFDESTRFIEKVSINRCIEDIKLKLS